VLPDVELFWSLVWLDAVAEPLVALAPLWLGLPVEFESCANDRPAQSNKADPKIVSFLIAISPDLIFLPELRNPRGLRGCFDPQHLAMGTYCISASNVGFQRAKPRNKEAAAHVS
jgi:hypothetical protein